MHGHIWSRSTISIMFPFSERLCTLLLRKGKSPVIGLGTQRSDQTLCLSNSYSDAPLIIQNKFLLSAKGIVYLRHWYRTDVWWQMCVYWLLCNGFTCVLKFPSYINNGFITRKVYESVMHSVTAVRAYKSVLCNKSCRCVFEHTCVCSDAEM